MSFQTESAAVISPTKISRFGGAGRSYLVGPFDVDGARVALQDRADVTAVSQVSRANLRARQMLQVLKVDLKGTDDGKCIKAMSEKNKQTTHHRRKVSYRVCLNFKYGQCVITMWHGISHWQT